MRKNRYKKEFLEINDDEPVYLGDEPVKFEDQ